MSRSNSSDSFRFDDSSSVLVGSGTLGLWLTFEALEIRNGRIAIPVNVCPSVVQAVLYSGNKPVYVDIEPEYMGMSPDELTNFVDDVDCVVAVHAYGTVCDIQRIRKICQKSGKPLVEDCAQALGARLNGEPVGGFGDAAVFSFGAGKIIDLGLGGAVSSRDASLIRTIRCLSAELPEWTLENDRIISDFSALHTFHYNRFYPDREHRFSGSLLQAALDISEAYRFRVPSGFGDRLRHALERLGENLELRRRRARQFMELFSKTSLNHLWPGDRSVFWRFNLLVPSNRNGVLRQLLSEQFKVSSWYPRIDRFLGPYDPSQKFPVAERFGDILLNLWVNHEVDEPYIEAIWRRIMQLVGAPDGISAVRKREGCET